MLAREKAPCSKKPLQHGWGKGPVSLVSSPALCSCLLGSGDPGGSILGSSTSSVALRGSARFSFPAEITKGGINLPSEEPPASHPHFPSVSFSGRRMEALSDTHVTAGHDKYLGEQGWQGLAGGRGNPCLQPRGGRHLPHAHRLSLTGGR